MTDRRAEALDQLDWHERVTRQVGRFALTEEDGIRLIEGLRAVLERHRPGPFHNPAGVMTICTYCAASWPCIDYRDAERAILGTGAEDDDPYGGGNLEPCGNPECSEWCGTGAEGTQEVERAEMVAIAEAMLPAQINGMWIRNDETGQVEYYPSDAVWVAPDDDPYETEMR